MVPTGQPPGQADPGRGRGGRGRLSRSREAHPVCIGGSWDGGERKLLSQRRKSVERTASSREAKEDKPKGKEGLGDQAKMSACMCMCVCLCVCLSQEGESRTK